MEQNHNKRLILMLEEIRAVDDVDVKNCALESLIDMLNDKELNEKTNRKRSQSHIKEID